MPTFKSYLDLLILSYIHVMYEMDLPFVLGMSHLSDISFVSSMLRKSGFFFVEKSKVRSDNLYRIVFEEYLATILKNKGSLVYHVGEKRESTGKISEAEPGLFECFVNAYLHNQNDL